jgi:hypothetical protein
MNVTELHIAGSWLITPRRHEDERGWFQEWFKHSELLTATGYDFSPVQANISQSKHGTIRGIHYSTAAVGQHYRSAVKADAETHEDRDDCEGLAAQASTEDGYDSDNFASRLLLSSGTFKDGYKETLNESSSEWNLSTKFNEGVSIEEQHNIEKEAFIIGKKLLLDPSENANGINSFNLDIAPMILSPESPTKRIKK